MKFNLKLALSCRLGLLLSLCCGLLAITTTTAHADDPTVPWYGHSLKWYEQHSYYRLGAGRLIYFGGSTPANLDNPSGKATLAIKSGPIEGSSAGLNRNNTTLAGELGFIIPWWGEHLSVEIAIAPPLKLEFDAHGTLASQSIGPYALQNQPGQPAGDPLPTGVGPLGTKLGTLHALPPQFTLVYRPWLHTLIRPYVGIGAVWLFTYNTDVTNSVLINNVQKPQLVLSRPIGCVAQAGFDIRLPWHFYLTTDARYLGCATVHAELRHIMVYSPTLSPSLGPVSVGTVSTNANFRALLVQVSIGSTFWGN